MTMHAIATFNPTRVGINEFCPTITHGTVFPSELWIDLITSKIRQAIAEAEPIFGMVILELEVGKTSGAAWMLVPKNTLDPIPPCITCCFASLETDHALFAEAIKFCRDTCERLMEEVPEEEREAAYYAFHKVNGPVQTLTCPAGPWLATVNGPELWGSEVCELAANLQLYGNLNDSIAATLLFPP